MRQVQAFVSTKHLGASKPRVCWDTDASLDFMLKVGMTPKLELSFFPAVVSNCTAFMPTMGHSGLTVNPGHEHCKQGFFYGGIMSVPRNGYDASGWVEFVSAFAQHIAGRYGRAEIERWRYEVWNEYAPARIPLAESLAVLVLPRNRAEPHV